MRSGSAASIGSGAVDSEGAVSSDRGADSLAKRLRMQVESCWRAERLLLAADGELGLADVKLGLAAVAGTPICCEAGAPAVQKLCRVSVSLLVRQQMFSAQEKSMSLA